MESANLDPNEGRISPYSVACAHFPFMRCGTRRSARRPLIAAWVAAAVCLVGSPALAATITINFGTYPDQPATQEVLTDQFAHLGVVFSSPNPENRVIWAGINPDFGSFGRVFRTENLLNGLSTPDPIRIDFVDPLSRESVVASVVSIMAFDGGGDLDRLDVLGYNEQDELVARSFYGPGPGDFGIPRIVTVTNPDISYVVLETSNTMSGLFFRRVEFESDVVPEPGTGLLLALGLVGLSRRGLRRGPPSSRRR